MTEIKIHSRKQTLLISTNISENSPAPLPEFDPNSCISPELAHQKQKHHHPHHHHQSQTPQSQRVRQIQYLEKAYQTHTPQKNARFHRRNFPVEMVFLRGMTSRHLCSHHQRMGGR
uniref:Uncharacterized protein n=1 Tax=Salix viminalis TaxID=40686 RepID=A0A6N2LE49_SALVM